VHLREAAEFLQLPFRWGGVQSSDRNQAIPAQRRGNENGALATGDLQQGGVAQLMAHHVGFAAFIKDT
jgi:hypothetical protein